MRADCCLVGRGPGRAFVATGWRLGHWETGNAVGRWGVFLRWGVDCARDNARPRVVVPGPREVVREHSGFSRKMGARGFFLWVGRFHWGVYLATDGAV